MDDDATGERGKRPIPTHRVERRKPSERHDERLLGVMRIVLELRERVLPTPIRDRLEVRDVVF